MSADVAAGLQLFLLLWLTRLLLLLLLLPMLPHRRYT